MKKISRWLMPLIVMVSWSHAAAGQDELDLYSNQQPPRTDTMPETALPVPETDTGSTRFEPNRDVSDIPTTEVFISPTRSKSVTRTISRPASTPQQNPAVIEPMIAPMIYPGYRPYPQR